jgi:hypothetical protein
MEYPEDKLGRKDHKAAITTIFGRPPAPSKPVHARMEYEAFEDEVATITHTESDYSVLRWHFGENYDNPGAQVMETETAWAKWSNGNLVPVSLEYLTTDERVFSSELLGTDL